MAARICRAIETELLATGQRGNKHCFVVHHIQVTPVIYHYNLASRRVIVGYSVSNPVPGDVHLPAPCQEQPWDALWLRHLSDTQFPLCLLHWNSCLPLVICQHQIKTPPALADALGRQSYSIPIPTQSPPICSLGGISRREVPGLKVQVVYAVTSGRVMQSQKNHNLTLIISFFIPNKV